MAPTILIRFGALGDVLLAIPVARALQTRGEEVHWILGRRWAEFASFLPVDRVHLFGGTRDLLPLARRLRRLHPARVIDLQGKAASYLLSTLIGGPLRRYAKRHWREGLRAATGAWPLRDPDERPVWQRYWDTAGLPCSRETLPDGHLKLDTHAVSPATFDAGTASDTPLLLLHPGASQPGKVLPAAALAALLDSLPGPIALIGDRPSPLGIDLSGRRNLHDMRGLVPLPALPALMEKSRGLVTTDSGPMHLSRALDLPLAAIFLQTDPLLGFAPLPGGKTRVISRDLPCKPCSLHGQRSVCPEGHWRCRDLDWSALGRELAGFFA